MLDNTLGGVNSNSYVTLIEAEDYFEDRMHSSAWTNVTDQEPFLISASRMLDWYVKWKGSKTTSEQSMLWPRIGVVRSDGTVIDSNIIPSEVKIAVFELAFSNINNDRTLEDPLAGIGQIQAGSLMIKAGAEKPNNTNAKLMPSHVLNIVSDLYNRGSVVRLVRG
jgi:hypothetical protein